MRVTSLDDAAWAGPWRRVRVGEKLLLCLGLLGTALLAPAWPGSALVAAAATVLALGPARIPARLLALASAPPGAFILVGGLSVGVRVGEPSRDAWWAVSYTHLDVYKRQARGGQVGQSRVAQVADDLVAGGEPRPDDPGGDHR